MSTRATIAKRARNERVKKTRGVAAIDRCDLCGVASTGTFRGDFRHLRSQHSRYARGLLLRLCAPVVFLVGVGVLGLLHAPQWSYFVALGAAGVLAVVGTIEARRSRKRARVRSAPSFGKLMRDGGFRFLLLPALLAVILFLTVR